MGQEDAFAPGDALRKAEILYVDGDSHRRDALRRLLLSLGAARVQVAESGKDAIKVVLGTPCNLVIVEYGITPADGIQLLREIRKATNYPRALVPVLMVSDPIGSDIIAAAFEAGANHFLIRPLHAPKLYERIAWALGDSRPFVVKDGRYVFKPAKPKVAGAGAARPATK
jgi:PleD family two-component response regulator